MVIKGKYIKFYYGKKKNNVIEFSENYMTLETIFLQRSYLEYMIFFLFLYVKEVLYSLAEGGLLYMRLRPYINKRMQIWFSEKYNKYNFVQYSKI